MPLLQLDVTYEKVQYDGKEGLNPSFKKRSTLLTLQFPANQVECSSGDRLCRCRSDTSSNVMISRPSTLTGISFPLVQYGV